MEKFMTLAKFKRVSDGGTFIEAVLAGECDRDDIDDCIDAWHDLGLGRGRSLTQVIGLSEPEYAEYLHDAGVLGRVIDGRTIKG